MRLGNLKNLRIGRNLNQQDVADVLGMTRSAYSLIETGKREMDFYSLLKLADYFNTSTDYILGHTRDPRSISELKSLPPDYTEIDVIYDELSKITGVVKPVTKAQVNELLRFIRNYPSLFIGLGDNGDDGD